MAIGANHLSPFALELHQHDPQTHRRRNPPPLLCSPLLRTRQQPSVQVRAVLGEPKQLIASETVKSIHPKDASTAIDSDRFLLLDVQPEWEWVKARVPGSLHVPLFVKDEDNGPLTLLKKWVHFGYIGLWTGQQLTTINTEFVSQVERLIPD